MWQLGTRVDLQFMFVCADLVFAIIRAGHVYTQI